MRTMQAFRCPPSSRVVGYTSKERGRCGRAREDPAGVSQKVSKWWHLLWFLFCNPWTDFLWVQVLSKIGETCCFTAHIHSPSQQPPMPAKHVVSPPTPTLPYNNHRNTHAYAVSSKLRPYNWANVLPPSPLAFVELAGVDGISNGSDGHIRAIEATGPCPPPTKDCDT